MSDGIAITLPAIGALAVAAAGALSLWDLLARQKRLQTHLLGGKVRSGELFSGRANTPTETVRLRAEHPALHLHEID